jgi:WD40 repeat protein
MAKTQAIACDGVSEGTRGLAHHVEKDKLALQTKKVPVGACALAEVRRHRGAIAGAVLALATLVLSPALARDQGPNAGTDLYDRPVLAIDPGMHTASIQAQAVDAGGRFAVTGGDDRTVRIWSVADGKLLRTIWIPVGPESVGFIYAVAISPDGSTIAVGGSTESLQGDHPIYLFDRESGNLIRRIHGDLTDATRVLTFSPDGRYLAATLGGSGKGLRVFDRVRDWSEAFRDNQYGDLSEGAAFARDGRLVTTAFDGFIRLYAYDPKNDSPNFRLVGEPMRALSGNLPKGVAFSPDSKHLAVGYENVDAVDVLDGATLAQVGGQKPANFGAGLSNVAWSRDGQTLLAVGAAYEGNNRPRLLFAWDRGGLGPERRMAYCADNSTAGVDSLPQGRILVASKVGHPIWTVRSPTISDLADKRDTLKVSSDGNVVDYIGYEGVEYRFDVRSLILSGSPPDDDLTFAPNRQGLRIGGWRGSLPTLNGHALPFGSNEVSNSVAIAPDLKRFFLATTFGTAAFDAAGVLKWRRDFPAEAGLVNASRDGRIVLASYDGGTIRWYRTDDGRELLALQVLPNKNDATKWDWVLSTPEGFYEATLGAQEVLKWVVNHGPDKAATTLPVSAIPRLHRPDALPLVLQELETSRALCVADVAAARLAVQRATGSAKPPGGVLHVLSIGVDKFGDKAGGLHLDYAAADAHDVATALLESQIGGPQKPSLYADVALTYLPNDKAYSTNILDALDAMAQSMAKSGLSQDMAIIFVSTYSEMIDGQFYFIPYGFDISSPTAAKISALSASEFAEKVQAIAAHGKVLLLLDACHSGAVGLSGSDPDASVLRSALNMDNVTVVTSSVKQELSQELPSWGHGAFTQAFLDALSGGADPEGRGVISVPELIRAMDRELNDLTQGQQHLGPRMNFLGDVLVVSR